MTADSFDDFEYEPASAHVSEERRRHYWAVAIGLQDVDNLKVSGYLKQVSQAYISGEKTLVEVGSLVRGHHARYYRDALVRAMYRNAPARIYPELKYLCDFYSNLLRYTQVELRREDLVCPELFEDPSLLRNIDPKDALVGSSPGDK